MVTYASVLKVNLECFLSLLLGVSNYPQRTEINMSSFEKL
jgi:hypothetical protein